VILELKGSFVAVEAEGAFVVFETLPRRLFRGCRFVSGFVVSSFRDETEGCCPFVSVLVVEGSSEVSAVVASSDVVAASIPIGLLVSLQFFMRATSTGCVSLSIGVVRFVSFVFHTIKGARGRIVGRVPPSTL
jgi:hypothetical protein